MNDTFAAAEAIAACRRNRTPLHPLAGDSAPQTEAEGYRIADAVHGLLARDFGEMVGHKIGCTSAVMQHQRRTCSGLSVNLRSARPGPPASCSAHLSSSSTTSAAAPRNVARSGLPRSSLSARA